MYMNFQMIPAPTKEIAIGRKMRLFAADSNLTRSARTAAIKPKPVDNKVTTMTHQRLFITVPLKVEKTAKMSRNAPIAEGVRKLPFGCSTLPCFFPDNKPATTPAKIRTSANTKRRLVKMFDQSLKSTLDLFVRISP